MLICSLFIKFIPVFRCFIITIFIEKNSNRINLRSAFLDIYPPVNLHLIWVYLKTERLIIIRFTRITN